MEKRHLANHLYLSHTDVPLQKTCCEDNHQYDQGFVCVCVHSMLFLVFVTMGKKKKKRIHVGADDYVTFFPNSEILCSHENQACQGAGLGFKIVKKARLGLRM